MTPTTGFLVKGWIAAHQSNCSTPAILRVAEDLVRDIAIEFNNDDRIAAYVVESENFESIHNHSAYAKLKFDKDKKNK